MTSTSTDVRHEKWCVPATHAELRDDLGLDVCAGHMIEVQVPGRREPLAGFWQMDAAGPEFRLDMPFLANISPDGVRALLDALEGAGSPLGGSLRTLLIRALAQLDPEATDHV